MVRSPRASTSRRPVGSHTQYIRALDEAVAEFGAAVRPLLRAGVAQREASLTAPIMGLLQRAVAGLGLTPTIHPEAAYRHLGVRPDLAVDVGGTRAGVVELKATGHGIPGDKGWGDARDRKQWNRLCALPNVLYTDGQRWGRYHYGERKQVAELDGNLRAAGDRLRPADDGFAALLECFVLWQPDPPRDLSELIRVSAGLCRLLRDEVVASLEAERRGRAKRLFLVHLADWQEWLFPDLDEAGFADAYAQTVTFGLLLARQAGVVFEGLEIPDIARRLAKTHLLVGRALTILTESPGKGPTIEQRSIVLQTMRQVIGVADWSKWPAAGTYHWLYEEFLQAYDPVLRRETGSYYTPTAVTDFIVRFVDEVLQRELGVQDGVAANDVVVLDPAMGTGTFLQSVVDRVAAHVDEDGGDVAGALRDLVPRLIGFERQVGPYAVAELKLDQALLAHKLEVSDENLRLYVADTLGDPNNATLPARAYMYGPLSDSLHAANRVKTTENVMVVLGNPPYRARAKPYGRWVLAHSRVGSSSLLDDFRAPGNGRHEFKLHDMAIYFWRWALWKAFESTPSNTAGVVAFITTKAYLDGPGFAGMRRYLRQKADLGWIIDLSAEGHWSQSRTRVFPGVPHPVCIGIFARTGRATESSAARIRYLSLSGTQNEKFDRLSQIHLDHPGFKDAPSAPDAPLQPIQSASWTRYPRLDDLMPYDSPGVTANRTWVHHPDPEVLAERWTELVTADAERRRVLLKETASRTIDSVFPSSTNTQARRPLRDESSRDPNVTRIGFRSFDRQHMIADPRVLDRERPDLWSIAGPRQVFLVTHTRSSVTSGPAAVFSSLVPDTHSFKGHDGGRVIPMYRERDARTLNALPAMARAMMRRLGVGVREKDVMPYVAAVVAHPGYTKRFAEELQQPGVRVPLTADASLWREAVELGRKVIWLNTYGERCTGSGRPPGVPRSLRPRVIEPISGRPEDMPEDIRYDAETESLRFGTGAIGPVSERAWLYDVCGMRVIKHWFDYRKRHPAGKKGGSPLDELTTTCWPNSMTEELRNLVAVLEGCLALEPTQADLLDRIVAGPLVTTTELHDAKVLPPPAESRRSSPTGNGLF